MTIIKTITTKHNNVEVEKYINIPVIDGISSWIDLKDGNIHGNNKSKVIGVVIDAKDIGNGEVELTITLWKNKFQGEYIIDEDGNVEPIAFSMGFTRWLHMSKSVESIENNILDKTAEIYNMFSKLEQTHPHDINDMVDAIHDIQKIIAIRIARRVRSDKFVTNNQNKGKDKHE